jgi:hypothetical protein
VQTDHVGRIGIDGKGINDYFKTTAAARSFVQAGKLISNPAATLTRTYHD